MHHLIAVVLLDDALRSRLVLPALVGHLRFATDTHACFELCDAPRQLPRLLADYPSCAASLVVVLPNAGVSGNEVDAVAEAFIQASNLTLRHVVGIAEEPARWKTLRHVQRFVATALCGHTLAVRSLFQTLGAIMAPVAILEADDEEIEQCLGTASAPSFFVHSRWNAEPGLEVSEDFRPVRQDVSTSMVTMLDSPSVAIARSALEQWEAGQQKDPQGLCLDLLHHELRRLQGGRV
ncbi:hypothetical protein [Variovorax sp. RA8]|uniref:hypothetical protein n=1 Tax=Variovorax sp. (strain JCM 16519 / RA8) TaxID=662548 RepID=UPI001E2A055B|nr:hypothetical protein [Variovorax sp. RA8]